MAGGGKQKRQTERRKQQQVERRAQQAHLRQAVALGAAPSVEAAAAMPAFALRMKMDAARRRAHPFVSAGRPFVSRHWPTQTAATTAMERLFEGWERQDRDRNVVSCVFGR